MNASALEEFVALVEASQIDPTVGVVGKEVGEVGDDDDGEDAAL